MTRVSDPIDPVSPDNLSLASGSHDGTIKLWSIDSGTCLETFNNQPYANMNITNIQGIDQQA
jgi:WD40 repeat protein